MKEIPRVDESDLPTLFYSEADIDGMYQEAEGKAKRWRGGGGGMLVVRLFCFCEICLLCLLFFFE